jgi:hypothetical protein
MPLQTKVGQLCVRGDKLDVSFFDLGVLAETARICAH